MARVWVFLLVAAVLSRSIDQKIDELLSQMTLEEKVGQTLHYYVKKETNLTDVIDKYGPNGLGTIYVFDTQPFDGRKNTIFISQYKRIKETFFKKQCSKNQNTRYLLAL